MRRTVTECDGCGARDTRDKDALSLDGWRHLTVWWTLPSGAQTNRSWDVCPDELCAARVVDATRRAQGLRVVGGARRESPQSGR